MEDVSSWAEQLVGAKNFTPTDRVVDVDKTQELPVFKAIPQRPPMDDDSWSGDTPHYSEPDVTQESRSGSKIGRYLASWRQDTVKHHPVWSPMNLRYPPTFEYRWRSAWLWGFIAAMFVSQASGVWLILATPYTAIYLFYRLWLPTKSYGKMRFLFWYIVGLIFTGVVVQSILSGVLHKMF